MTTPAPRKKLIEVALPLEAINQASAREKSIRHGHPSTLHLWWARRPLAAARAVIFTSLVDDPDDPGALPAFVEACKKLPGDGPNTALHDTPRARLFDFIERLVQWEATTDETIMSQARDLIRIATEGNPPPLLDPFAGGGSIPLEAQRLGLEAHASDLNPVAVLINKAQIEIPPRFANQPPVNPKSREEMFGGRGTMHRAPASRGAVDSGRTPTMWRGASGLAADVRYYGEWMRERAWERIGHLYPKYHPSPPGREDGGEGGETVIAWLWARTVQSPNPAVNVQVPLVRSFELSKKKGKRAWVEPVVEALTPGPSPKGRGEQPTHRIRFVVRREQDGDDPRTIPDGTVNRRGGTCVVTGAPITRNHLYAEGQAGRIGVQLLAIVTEGRSGRNYYSPDQMHEQAPAKATPAWAPDGEMPDNPRWFSPPAYGMRTFADLFTPRQLVALTTFSDLVAEARAQAEADALAAGLPDDGVPLRDGGRGAKAYAEAVSVYLAFAVDRLSEKCNNCASWQNSADFVRGVFSRQAIAMVWDYAEVNAFSGSTGNFYDNVEWVAECVDFYGLLPVGKALMQDATRVGAAGEIVLSTDPPYYDNIGYADLSDFFYVWLRPMLRDAYPAEFGTLLVPKLPELVATPYRFGGDRQKANAHFEGGMLQTFSQMRRYSHPDFPQTVYYAFKQQEADEADEEDEDMENSAIVSTGWETMLSALIRAGFSIDGTWPMRTERGARSVSIGTNALASSIVLVCRPRPENAPSLTRRQFVDALRRELPPALKAMQSGAIAPVDLAQASIGPGMAVFSRHSKVLEPDGAPMSVRTALALINQELDAYLAEQDGYLDTDTRFAVAWFEQYAFAEGEFGVADTLARAKNTSVDGVAQAGVVTAGRGKVRLIPWQELDASAWDPAADQRLTAWEAVHHLIERLNTHGESGAAGLMMALPGDVAAQARDLAYRLYAICERKGWAEEARDYNALVVSFPAIGEEAAHLRANQTSRDGRTQQPRLL